MEQSIKFHDIDHKKFLDSYLNPFPPVQTDSLVSFSIIDPNDSDISTVNSLLSTLSFSSLKESKALAMFIGSAIGDALGAHLECQNFNPQGYGITDFPDIQNKRFPLGQWTDDTAEALCLSDSLLINDLKFNPHDIRTRFVHWWFSGYNNGKKNQEGADRRRVSEGIGGYTLEGLHEFIWERTPFAPKKDQRSSNGSIMRVTPIPLAFHFDIEIGQKFAGEQSYCTHDGDEAAECCRLLTFLGIKALNHKEKGFKVAREVLDLAGVEFKSCLVSVDCLAKSLKETDFAPYEVEKSKLEDKKNLNKSLEDRNWNWKDEKFEFSAYRIQQRKNLIGIYAMDCVAMSLHILYHNEGFNNCVLKAINMGGDADSLGGVTGMLAGAFYGMSQEILDKYKYLQKWDENSIALHAFKLINLRK